MERGNGGNQNVEDQGRRFDDVGGESPQGQDGDVSGRPGMTDAGVEKSHREYAQEGKNRLAYFHCCATEG